MRARVRAADGCEGRACACPCRRARLRASLPPSLPSLGGGGGKGVGEGARARPGQRARWGTPSPPPRRPLDPAAPRSRPRAEEEGWGGGAGPRWGWLPARARRPSPGSCPLDYRAGRTGSSCKVPGELKAGHLLFLTAGEPQLLPHTHSPCLVPICGTPFLLDGGTPQPRVWAGEARHCAMPLTDRVLPGLPKGRLYVGREGL